jgi:hypothetical protein
MKTLIRGLALGLVLPLCSTSFMASGLRAADRASGTQPADSTGDILLSTMQRELQRATAKLGQLDPAPYFASYSMTRRGLWLWEAWGAC